MLTDKVALVYGAGGAIGGAIARAFGAAGAHVFLAGRTGATLDRVAHDIRAAGGTADTAVVDALDERAVTAFVDGVAKRTGRIDISCNVIGVGDVQKPLAELTVEEFLQPVTTALRTQFLTTGAAVRHMVRRGTGVILAFGGSGPQTVPGIGGFKVALDAVEGHRRQWAREFGAQGIRVVTLKTGGIPESVPADMAGRDDLVAALTGATLLKRTATLADVGNAAVFVASELARTITSADVNISCGAIVDP